MTWLIEMAWSVTMALNDLFFSTKFGYITITSNGDVLVNGINFDDLARP